jgi:hypothetical protein
MIARHEYFLGSLLSESVSHADDAWRRHLAEVAEPTVRPQISSWDAKMLRSAARRRVSLKKRGDALTRTFNAIFGFPPWPNADVLSTVLDLNLLRQLIVHHDNASVGDDYWAQLSDKELLDTEMWGRYAVRRVNVPACLAFLPKAAGALSAQVKHLRNEVAARDIWRS